MARLRFQCKIMGKGRKSEFEKIANSYVHGFSKKQGLEFDFWVGDEVGGIASFNHEYFINYDDIRMDLDDTVKKGVITEWYWHVMPESFDFNPELSNERPYVNYKSYLKGARISKATN